MRGETISAEGELDAIGLLERHLSPSRAQFYRELGDVPVPVGSAGVFVMHGGGAALLDCRSAGGVFNLGHRNAGIRELVVDGLDEVDIGDWLLPSLDRGKAAGALTRTLPDELALVTFATSGGEAIDIACELARRKTGRTRIVATDNAYHGQVGISGQLSQAGSAAVRVESGEVGTVPFGDIDAVVAALDDSVAAFVVEPIQAAAGVMIPAPEYLRSVRSRCDDTGTVLVVDEVQTGLGRTGSMWAIDHIGIVPDILVAGKGLSGGIYPVAACVYTQAVGRSIDGQPFFRPSSFGGSEIGCRIARYVVDTVRADGFLASVRECGQLLGDGLDDLVASRPGLFSAARGVGLMRALDLREPGRCMEFAGHCWRAGLLVSPAPNHPGSVLVMPPLVITVEEVAVLLERLRTASRYAHG